MRAQKHACLSGRHFGFALAAALCSSGAGAQAPSQPADLIVTHARVITLDPAKPRATALAVRGGSFVAVGTDQEVARLRGPKTRVLEMTAPTKFTAKLEEPALKEDATSGQKSEQLPVYNAYSANGDVTGELVSSEAGRRHSSRSDACRRSKS